MRPIDRIKTITKHGGLLKIGLVVLMISIGCFHAYNWLTAKARVRNMQDLTDACLANVGGASGARNEMAGADANIPLAWTAAPWLSSQADRIMQSATPHAVKFCTCISQKFVDRDLYSLVKHSETFRTAVVKAVSECGGAPAQVEHFGP